MSKRKKAAAAQRDLELIPAPLEPMHVFPPRPIMPCPDGIVAYYRSPDKDDRRLQWRQVDFVTVEPPADGAGGPGRVRCFGLGRDGTLHDCEQKPLPPVDASFVFFGYGSASRVAQFRDEVNRESDARRRRSEG